MTLLLDFMKLFMNSMGNKKTGNVVSHYRSVNTQPHGWILTHDEYLYHFTMYFLPFTMYMPFGRSLSDLSEATF